ncbi:Bug family tripartite tricarboxylate transporter substrate binding protein [Polynucleobacter asymbioticus]|jgi:tripartite-type tricarboxylate transporter receptor subunit TctC|uniref:LacI family transcriptional regulator n=1 Tax=Polynucleobacter asymbioticus TaxID=576611 RepID=A0AAC9IWI9_9BURK|nr:tripartite tricarboxylate transporter substrate binding protein [Polynucleobacter asymbioticus]APC00077.1 LacI family transcriptional regulator [Polynucleobacter asymbioticus]APC02385.1 LacI family transcriptional regulator [Polynucleobacter asymbioticus]
MNKKKIRGVAFFFGISLAGLVFAQAYPSKPISLVVPQTAGGTNDIVARLIAPAFGEAIGSSVIVENKPGAGGNIGTQGVARAPKDGYTLLLTINSAQAINPALYKNPGFDPINDFIPVYYIGATPYVLVSPPGSPYKTLAEVVAAAKRKPGELSYASAGNGTISHLLGAMLNTSAGIDMQHIPYKGVAPAINDVLGGQVPLAFASLPSALNYIKAGKLQAIAISSAKRSSAAPEIPTIAETYPDCVGEVWVALFAPIGTPAAVVKKIQSAMDKVMASPEVREKLAAQGLDLSPVTPSRLVTLLKDELAKWVKIVKASGAQLD